MSIAEPVVCSFKLAVNVKVIEGVRIKAKETLVILIVKGLK